jgi:hypothetical protein
MSDTYPVVVWLPSLRQHIPVPDDLQTEARELDNADLQPGNNQISQAETVLEKQPQFRRIAEASLKAFNNRLLSDIDHAAVDPKMMRSLADKGKLAALAKTELPKLNQELGTNVRSLGVETVEADDAKSPTYTMHLVDENELHKQWGSNSSADLTLTPTDTAASLSLKATLGFEKLPSGARAFLAKHGGESAATLLTPLRDILFTQGFSASTLGLADPDRREKKPVLDEVTYDASRDRLIIKSSLASYPGQLELQVLEAGVTKTLVANWKSADGKSERVTSYDRGKWNAIAESGTHIEPPRRYF